MQLQRAKESNHQQLTKENQELREQLKQLNEKISEAIEQHRSSTRAPRPNSQIKLQNKGEYLNNILKQQSIYQKEKEELNKKWEKLSSPNHLQKLKEDIRKYKEKVSTLTKKNQKLSNQQKINGNRITNFVKNDPAVEQNKKMSSLIQSISIYNDKISQLEQIIEKNNEIYDEQYEQECELQDKLDQLIEIAEHYGLEQINNPKKYKQIKQQIQSRAKQKKDIQTKQQKIINQAVRLKQDQYSLTKLLKVEDAINKDLTNKIRQKQIEIDNKQSELLSAIDKATQMGFGRILDQLRLPNEDQVTYSAQVTSKKAKYHSTPPPIKKKQQNIFTAPKEKPFSSRKNNSLSPLPIQKHQNSPEQIVQNTASERAHVPQNSTILSKPKLDFRNPSPQGNLGNMQNEFQHDIQKQNEQQTTPQTQNTSNILMQNQPSNPIYEVQFPITQNSNQNNGIEVLNSGFSRRNRNIQNNQPQQAAQPELYQQTQLTPLIKTEDPFQVKSNDNAIQISKPEIIEQKPSYGINLQSTPSEVKPEQPIDPFQQKAIERQHFIQNAFQNSNDIQMNSNPNQTIRNNSIPRSRLIEAQNFQEQTNTNTNIKDPFENVDKPGLFQQVNSNVPTEPQISRIPRINKPVVLENKDSNIFSTQATNKTLNELNLADAASKPSSFFDDFDQPSKQAGDFQLSNQLKPINFDSINVQPIQENKPKAPSMNRPAILNELDDLEEEIII